VGFLCMHVYLDKKVGQLLFGTASAFMISLRIVGINTVGVFFLGGGQREGLCVCWTYSMRVCSSKMEMQSLFGVPLPL
jgi:hypothetical protein